MEEENVRKFNMIKITAIFFVIISLLIMIPSIIFNVLHNNDKIINYVDSNIFYGLINKPIDKQYPIFLIVTIILTILFLLMCKFRKRVFKSTKSLIQFIIIIGAIYAIMIPHLLAIFIHILQVEEFKQNIMRIHIIHQHLI